MDGTRIGNYVIEGKLGAGGMGEVYRATDSKLGRAVAIKVLPEIFAQDPERVARFEREAKTLASLNHPNIAAIYGVEEADGRLCIAMELVEGMDLSERMANGPIPLDDAVDIARQMAEGLEEAHTKGVVHRDLKPANVKISRDGQVKILDFGLARAFQGDAVNEEQMSNSPTITAMTHQGVILGTAAYMSPEQARGKPVDKRSDMWAFGVVVYEMLTGQRLFSGETVSDTVASILRNDPDWDALPAETPEGLRRLLRRCLERDARRRQRSAGDAVLELEDKSTPGGVRAAVLAKPPLWRALIPWAVALTAVAALVVMRGAGDGSQSAPATPVQFEIPTLPDHVVTSVQISPDGRNVAIWATEGRQERVYLRSLDAFEWKDVSSGSPSGQQPPTNPFWSPDSRYLGLIAGPSLIRASLETGLMETMLEAAIRAPRGQSWGANGSIVFVPSPNSGIFLFPPGGTATPVTQVDSTLADASHRWPCWLPDQEHFLYTLWSNNPDVMAGEGGIYIGSVSGEPGQKLLDDDSQCLYVQGFLFLHRAGNLIAIPFDPTHRTVTGDAIQVVEHVGFNANNGSLAASVSETGALAWLHSESNTAAQRLVWLGQDGQFGDDLPFLSRATYGTISPDTKYIALTQFPSEANDTVRDIWIGSLDRGSMIRLTRGRTNSYNPVWSPDSKRIAFANLETGYEELYIQEISGVGQPERIFSDSSLDVSTSSWSMDGRWIFFGARSKEGGEWSIWAYDVEQREARDLLSDPGVSFGFATLSPDGKWLAYTSNESGDRHVYVRPFPELDRRWQVSTTSGFEATWNSDGSTLAFKQLEGNDYVMASVDWEVTNGVPTPSLPRTLFVLPGTMDWIAPTADLSRFVIALDETANSASIRVATQWQSIESKAK